MAAIRFRAEGQQQQATQTFKRRLRPKPPLSTSAKIMLAAAGTVAAVYATHQPGQVAFTSPAAQSYTDASQIIVSGRVENGTVRRIGLEQNGDVQELSVVDGVFSAPVQLSLGKNKIRVVTSGLGAHILNNTAELTVHAVQNPGPVEFTSPAPGQLIEATSVIVEGTVGLSDRVTDHQMRHINLEVNGQRATVAVNDGTFQTMVKLDSGENKIIALPNAQLAKGSETLRVWAPLVAHEFENTDHGWIEKQGIHLIPASVGDGGNPGQCLVYGDNPVPPSTSIAPLDLVFVIDSSGSMGSRINQVKDHTEEIIASLSTSEKDIHVGAVGYASGITYDFPLSDDVTQRIRSIGTMKAEGGRADTGDDQYAGIIKALNMKWRNGVAKAIILITDEGAAPDSYRRLSEEDRAVLSVEDLTPEALKTNAAGKEPGRPVHIFAIVVGDEKAATEDAAKLVENDQFIVGTTDETLVNRIVGLINYAREIDDIGIWQAPKSVVQQIASGGLGTSIRFDLLQRSSADGQRLFDADDVVLIGAEDSLRYRFPFPGRPPHLWQSYRVVVASEGGWESSQTGAKASNEEIANVIATLQQLNIRADYRAGRDDSKLDNFMVVPPTRRAAAVVDD